MDDSKLQEKYMEYQMLEQQVEKIQKNIQMTAEQLMEIEYIKNSLGEISQIEDGREILCPVASGIFIKANIKDSGNFFVNVGGNAVAVKDVTQAKSLMDSQAKEIEDTRVKLVERFNQLMGRMQEIEKEMMG